VSPLFAMSCLRCLTGGSGRDPRMLLLWWQSVSQSRAGRLPHFWDLGFGIHNTTSSFPEASTTGVRNCMDQLSKLLVSTAHSDIGN
jgi:hypothetical protein